MVENNNPDAVFPHSLSYEENYHSKYYYPRLICCRRALQRQQESPTHKLLITEISGGSVVTKIARPPAHCPSSCDCQPADRPPEEQQPETPTATEQNLGSVEHSPPEHNPCDRRQLPHCCDCDQHRPMQSCDGDNTVERGRPFFKLSDSDFSDDSAQMEVGLGKSADTDRGGGWQDDDTGNNSYCSPTPETPNSDVFSEGSSLEPIENGSTCPGAGGDHPRLDSMDSEEGPLIGFERALRLDIEAANKVANDTDACSPEDEEDAPTPPEINLLAGSDLNLSEEISGEEGDNEDAPEGVFYEDREFEFLKAEPVRRSTSLKTYKTPPGTPGKKKIVRFADALGLDLESVRHILNLDVPPKIPASATRYLALDPEPSERDRIIKSEGARYLTACFSQPGASPSFPLVVAERKVMLENCVINDQSLTITGTIRVANIHFHKQVLVRYSTNNWLTFNDVNAGYVHNSNDGPTDRFSFSISVPQYFSTGSRLEFCIQYTSGGTVFWDSNYGSNYVVECYARAIPADSDNSWMSFL